MANEMATVAQGELTLQIAAATQFFKFEIQADGIRFRRRDSAGGPWSDQQTLFSLLGTTTPALRKGYVTFAGLSASPEAAFRTLLLNYQPNQFTLNIKQPAAFASRENFQLKGLDITFTQRAGLERLRVSGVLTALILGQEVTLAPAFTPDGTLIFRAGSTASAKSTAALGALNLAALEIGARVERWPALQALFAFVEGPGSLPHDTSSAADPTAPDANIEQRLLPVFRASNEITIEAWVKPKAATSKGPILNLSKDPQNRYFALAQGDAAGNPALSLQAKLRTSEDAAEQVLITPADVSTNVPSYLTFTRAANGTANLYLNGVPVGSEVNIPGTLDWIGKYRLAVAKEPTDDQATWDGEIQRLAIYSRAVSPEWARLNQHPLALIRDRGTLLPTGRFTFPASATAPQFPLFDGNIEIRGEARSTAFSLNGQLRFFPEDSPLQISAELALPLASTGEANLQKQPVTVTLTDFQLLNPALTISTAGVTLTGRWLGQEITFNGSGLANEMSLRAANVTFNVPDTTLAPLTDAVTGEQFTENIKIRQIQAKLDLTLSSNGFLAQVTTSFQWAQSTAPLQTATTQPATIFAPPPTRNALFDLVIAELQKQANDLLAERVAHQEDYYIQTPTEAPLVIVHRASATAAPTPIQLQLPDLYSTAPTLPLQSAPSPSIFTLVKTTSPAGYLLTITIPATPDFAALRTAYEAFLANVEATGPKPGALELVKARLAEWLPLPFDQVLYYHYGLKAEGANPGWNQVDLQPGMRLRVDYQHYQLVHPSDLQALDGYVGGGSVYYYLSSFPLATKSEAKLTLGFDGFASGLQITTTPDLTGVGAAGVIELLHPAFRRRFFRLVYPNQLTGPGETGWTGTERVATIFGADTLTALKAGQSDNAAADARVSFSFRGRATVIPEIAVFVQGRPVYVPLGTTVRQLIERYARIPAAGLGQQNLSAFHGRLRPRRLVHEDLNSTPVYKFINFTNYAAVGVTDIHDLPVVKGDRYYF